jgi:hypothetical protein
LLVHGRRLSPGTPASSTTKTGRHDIAEILLKGALNTKIKSKVNSSLYSKACLAFYYFEYENTSCMLFSVSLATHVNITWKF